jgi:hypothetical protein
MRKRLLALLTCVCALCAVCSLPKVLASGSTTITISSGAGVTPPASGTIQDTKVEVSFDNVTWYPAYAADNTGYWPAPFPGTNWDVPSANRDQGYGDPENFWYRITFVLPAGFTAPSLSGFMGSDDQPVAVTLNGTAIANYPYEGYVYAPSPHAFATSDASLFQTGTNVVVFETLNLGGVTGVDFTGTVSYVSGLPTSTSQCKNGGWQNFGVFKNQGDCVSFVATGGKNQPAQ